MSAESHFTCWKLISHKERFVSTWKVEPAKKLLPYGVGVFVGMSLCVCLCAFFANCLWLWGALKQWTHHNHNFCCCLISGASASDVCVSVYVRGLGCNCWNIMHNLTGFPSCHGNCRTDFGLTLAFGLTGMPWNWLWVALCASIGLHNGDFFAWPGLHKPWKAAQTQDWTNRKATLHFSQGIDV